MTLIHRIAVYAHSLFAQRVWVLAANVALIGPVCLPTPVWAQWGACPTGSPTGSQCITAPVGIGTTSAPRANLDVMGGSILSGGNVTNWFPYVGDPYTGDYIQLAGTAAFHVQTLVGGQADVLVVGSNGQVSIGTSTLGQCGGAQLPCKLSVDGAIGAKEVVVTNNIMPDYVFDSGYQLRPLREVAAYIQEHHHLPEIPSAAEVKENGLSLGDMQAKLLAKIEELTLHLIQADEKNRELQERMARLEVGSR